MSNEYKDKYESVIKRLSRGDYNYFRPSTETIILPNGDKEERIVVKLLLNRLLLDNAYELATKKAQYTNDKDQSGKDRPFEIKVMNQLKGVLAEIGVHLILEEVLKLKGVKRWDLERENFEYKDTEYDLKFSINEMEYKCESRSSTSYKTTLSEFLSTCHVIGPYTSDIKSKEDANHFYFRPVFQYKELLPKSQKFLPYDYIKNTYKDIENSKLELYFISGATKSQMFGELHEEGTNNQSGTTYKQVRMNKLPDFNKFLENLKDGIY